MAIIRILEEYELKSRRGAAITSVLELKNEDRGEGRGTSTLYIDG